MGEITQIAILVPVLGRPHQIEPLIASVEAATSVAHRIVFICSPNDKTTTVCRRTGCEVIMSSWKPGRADFAKKINLAFVSTDEEWLFQAATDLMFHPHWDLHALRMAERRNFGVVGTNDLGNPLVQKGQHSTHTLFSREYIDKFGGTVDNSGTVMCELYDHQWCDNEFVQTAKWRDKWVFSRHSIVEHNHPSWGKAQMDSTYEKALRATVEDQTLFKTRLSLLNPNSPQARRERRLQEKRARMLARRQR